MGIDNDGNICKGMEDSSSSTDITEKFSLVSVLTNEQTLTIDFIFYVIRRCYHNRDAKILHYFKSAVSLKDNYLFIVRILLHLPFVLYV